MKFITFLVISMTSATLWGRVPTTTQQFSVRFGQEVNTLLAANDYLSTELYSFVRSLGDDTSTSQDIAQQLGVNVDEVIKVIRLFPLGTRLIKLRREMAGLIAQQLGADITKVREVIKLHSFDTRLSELTQEMEGLTDEKIVAKYRKLLAKNDSLFDDQTSERLNTFLYALDPTYARQTEAKLYAAYLENDHRFAFAHTTDSQDASRALMHMAFKINDGEYTPNWGEEESVDENDVEALYRKNFTNEAVTKLWAKGDDLSEAEQEELVELLKSSEGDTALAALQRPVTTKLAKLNDMMAEVLPAKTVEINKVVEEINTNVDRYETIRTMTSSYGKSIPQIKITATLVLQMPKVKGLTRLHNQLHLVGTPDDVVKANLYNRDFMKMKYFILQSNSYKESYPPALKKILAEGDLESEVFPIYNSLVRNDAGQDLTQLIAQPIIEAESTNSIEAALNSGLSSDLDKLLLGVNASAELFKKAGLSRERSNEIKLAHQRLKGAGEDGNQPITSLSVWANDMIAMVNRKLANADDNPSLVVLETVPPLIDRTEIWEEKMKEIADIE